MELKKVMYTAKVTSTGGREGESVSDDGRLKLRMAPPTDMDPGATNPEQLFAAGYSACFLSALKLVAGKRKVETNGAAVTAEVSLGTAGEAFGLAVKLLVSLPGLDAAKARELAAEAHTVCPYSNATRNNINVDIVVV